MNDLLTPSQFAKHLGPNIATDRQIRNFCAAGMSGATRDSKGRWKIDPIAAKDWMNDPANASRISGRMEIEVAVPSSPGPATSPATSARSGSLTSVLEKHIHDLNKVVEVLLSLLTSGKFNPQAATMLKQTLSEIRLAETHALQMRQADARFIDRDRHRRVCQSLGTVFRQDLEAMIARYPDVGLAKMTEMKVKIDDPAEALRAMRLAFEAEVHSQLTRLADRVERMDLET